MNRPMDKDTNAAEELTRAERKLEILTSDIADLQRKKTDLRAEIFTLKEQVNGLIPGQTMIRETKGMGIAERKPKIGQFIAYYSKYGTSSKWVKVLLLKKDGTVGKRTATFYDWEKVE